MKTSSFIVFIFLIVVGFFVFQRFFRNDFKLPSSGETKTETIILEDGKVVGTLDVMTESDATQDELDLKQQDKFVNSQEGVIEATSDSDAPLVQGETKTTLRTTKEISVTDGVRHTVPLGEIRGGGPPKDGIPPIDNPKFVSIADIGDSMTNEEPGLAFSDGDTHRFYPFQILVWHEIVNDTINGKRVLVTYCPLCLSGIVFDPMVKGERVEFGTSGKLWNSNLVMYDRKTDTLWSQILGEAIVGEMTGTELAILPADQMRFGNWKALHPDGEILSRETGAFRAYGKDPYGDYYTSEGVFFPVNHEDDRLEQKDFVLGIVIDGKAKAYLPSAIQKVGTVEDTFAGKTIVARYENDIDVVRLFEKKVDGTLQRINPFTSFWFSWVAVHPDTELYK